MNHEARPPALHPFFGVFECTIQCTEFTSPVFISFSNKKTEHQDRTDGGTGRTRRGSAGALATQDELPGAKELHGDDEVFGLPSPHLHGKLSNAQLRTGGGPSVLAAETVRQNRCSPGPTYLARVVRN